MDKKQVRNSWFSIDVRIRIRGKLYEIQFSQVLRWVSFALLMGFRLYRQLHGAGP